jgi:hypothetical protein
MYFLYGWIGPGINLAFSFKKKRRNWMENKYLICGFLTEEIKK